MCKKGDNMSENENMVESKYEGLFLTETVFGNPNGSFAGNKPRYQGKRIYTTDKCIKYNVRRYIYENVEDMENTENMVFFYPRLTEDAESNEESYKKKGAVFDDLFDGDFEKMKENCPDIRMFGGVFSFEEGNDKGSFHGPIQLSYGIDLMGADFIDDKLGTPFASETGSQTTTGENHLVDHAVIAYDIDINPNVQPNLLLKDDLDLFIEGIVHGTNLRKSTSKSTNAKLLLLTKFEEEYHKNLGELKRLVEIESDKVTQKEKENPPLTVNLENVSDRIKEVEESVDKVEIYKDQNVNIFGFDDEDFEFEVTKTNFYSM